MSAAPNLSRVPFPMDAALSQRGPASYHARRLPFAEVIRLWLAVIAGEQLQDHKIDSLHELSIDPRDGALTRGMGGLAYTPHAHSQLISLMRAGAPSESASERWHAPDTRALMWRDVKAAAKRPRTEGGVLRTFLTTYEGRAYRALRATVSGIHPLGMTDDAAIIAVLESLDETPVEGRFTRGWDATYAHFVLESGDADARLGFEVSNSETGSKSLGFAGSISIKALDCEVTMPSGYTYERIVSLGSDSARTTRRHTIPRYDSRSGRPLTTAQRQAIADGRIGKDVETALTGARVLAERWELAKADVLVAAIKFASLTFHGDETAHMVLGDFLNENGYGALLVTLGEAGLKELASVIANDTRLRSLPPGSAAHMAGALAVLAVTGDRTWESARELQAIAGAFVMEGWKR